MGQQGVIMGWWGLSGPLCGQWNSLEVSVAKQRSVGLIGGQWNSLGVSWGNWAYYGSIGGSLWGSRATLGEEQDSVEVGGASRVNYGSVGANWVSVVLCGVHWGLWGSLGARGGISVQCIYTHGKFFIILYERVNTLMISQFYICIVRKSWPFQLLVHGNGT